MKHRKISQQLAYYRKNRTKCLEYKTRWNHNHPNRNKGTPRIRTPEQWRAQNFIQRHPDLKGSKCEVCGASKNLVAHHPDYNYPEIAVTICSSCHNYIHKGIG